MERLVPLLRFLALLVLAVGSPGRALAYQPTQCAYPAVMQAEFDRFDLNGKSFLTNATGVRGSDNLSSHVTDFFRSSIGHNIDPRLPAAIAGVESLYGTGEGRCNYTTDNPWNLMDGKVCAAYGELTASPWI